MVVISLAYVTEVRSRGVTLRQDEKGIGFGVLGSLYLVVQATGREVRSTITKDGCYLFSLHDCVGQVK